MIDSIRQSIAKAWEGCSPGQDMSALEFEALNMLINKAEEYDRLKQIAVRHKLECIDPFVCKDGVELGCYAAIGKLIAGELE